MILAAIAAVIVVAAVGVSVSRRVNLNNYVEVTFEGYDGYGTARAQVDWDALSKKYDSRFRINDSGWTWSYTSFSELVDDCTYLSVDPRSGLSNGEEVTINWEVETEIIQSFLNKSVKLSAEPKTYTVSGLEEIATVDVFDEVSVEFSGVSPNATAEVIKEPEGLTITLSAYEGLSIGDSITATISEDSVAYYAEEYGRIPAELSKDYTVENVAYYVSSLDQIPEDGLEKMKAQAEDVMKASAAGWSDDAQFDSLDYLGCYFLYEKNGIRNNDVNLIYLVYEIHATQFGTDEKGNLTEEAVDYYWYCGFQNGIVLADGTYSLDYNDYNTPYTGWGSNETISVITYDYTQSYSWNQEIALTYAGFINVDSMFNNLVTSMIDEYTYESTVEES